MATSAQPKIKASDRLGFTVFMALAAHAIVVLTDFIPEDPEPAPYTMEITLARFDDGEKPEDAELLASTNQKGSGNESQENKITTDTLSQEQSMLMQESASPAQTTTEQRTEAKQMLSSTAGTRDALGLFELPSEAQEQEQPELQKSILERSLEIAQLEAKLDDQMRNYAKGERVTQLTAASSMKAVDARYVSAVIARIERVGKQHFPSYAGKKLYGKPTVLIAIYPDGSVRNVRIIESSGNLVLDDQTKEIVHRAAPFAPFPEEIRAERDVLELVRTFTYNDRGVGSSF